MSIQELIDRKNIRDLVKTELCEDGFWEATLEGLAHEAYGENPEQAITHLFMSLSNMRKRNSPEIFESLFLPRSGLLLEKVKHELDNLAKTAR